MRFCLNLMSGRTAARLDNEPSKWTYDHGPGLTVRSVPENATLASHPIASVFMF